MWMIRGLLRSHKPGIVAGVPGARRLGLSPEVATRVLGLLAPSLTELVYVVFQLRA